MSKTAAFVAGSVFNFSGLCFSLVSLLNWLFAFSYLPILLLFFHAYQTERKRRWLVALVCAGTLQIFAGCPEIVAITFISILVWNIVYPYKQTIPKRILSWGLAAFLTIGVAFVAFLPAMELTRQSMRGKGLEFHFATGYSIHPKRLPELIFSGFLGRYDSSRTDDFWGGKLVDQKDPYFLSIYVGPLTLLLALAAMLGREKAVLPERVVLLLFFSICAVWVLSLGKFLPGFRFLFENLPGLNTFRYPSKFLIFSALPIALLAGCGMDRICLKEHRRGLVISTWICFALISVFVFAFLNWPETSRFFLETRLH